MSKYVKPFSTYPEDRELLMSLARTIQTSNDVEIVDQAAGKLSDLVLAILSDEATDAFDEELDAADLMKIDQAWEAFKDAGPVAKVINDNQPGKTAIIEITCDPPTLEVGTELFTSSKAGEADALADKVEGLIAEFGDDPTAALQCVSEWLGLRRHAKASPSTHDMGVVSHG